MKSMITAALLALTGLVMDACAAPYPAAVPTGATAPPEAAAVAPSATPARPKILRIELADKPEIPDLPRMLAVERLREMGYTVETFQFDDNALSVQALEQGDLDVGNVSLGIAWNAIQKGAKLTTIVDDIGETRVLLAALEIKSCGDLDGKQVAVSSTASTQAHMINQYVADNCPGTKVEHVIIAGSANRLLALQAGQLAAVPVDLANYLAVQRQGNNGLHILTYFAQEFPGLRGTSQVVRRELIEKYPETAKDIVRAILLARRKLSDPQVLSEYIVKVNELEPQDAQETAKAFLEQHVWDLNGGLTPEMLQYNIDFFETAGALEPGLGPEDVADLGTLNAVLDEIGRKWQRLELYETLEYARMFARFPSSLRNFMNERITLEQAEERVRRLMAQRAENFLRMLEKSVYGVPASPYRALLKSAGCEQNDIREGVCARGLEPTLRELREAGVFVTYEEFKGRKPIVRNGLCIEVTPRDFDNPFARRDFSLTTGGSTGLANTVYQDLEHVAALATNEMLLLDAHGYLDAPSVHWTHMLPGSGLRFILQRVFHRQAEQPWFSPLGWREFRAWARYDAATLYMLFWMRAEGIRVPVPEIVKPENAIVVARSIRKTLDAHGRCVLYSNVSQAVRVALAAMDAGFDLNGSAVRLSSEPLTDAKAARIHAAQMQTIGGYGSIETGAIGFGCAKPSQVDDVHLVMDAFALIDYPYAVPNSDTTVPAFNLTALRASSPKVMLNYQSDDYGVVSTFECGCPLGAFGYSTHMHRIRSYSKLVGEGVTLVGNALLEILEVQLPARFGGTPLDYQWMEREDEKGLTRLVLLIHPRVKIEDETRVIPFVLNALREASPYADAARAVWQNAQTLQMERREPILTARSKLLPLHIQRS